MIDLIENQMEKAEEEIHEKPYQVIYYNDKIIQSLVMEDRRLNIYPLNIWST